MMNKIIAALVLLLLVVIYLPWLTNSSIIGGDWPYFYPEFLSQLPLTPPSWSGLHGNGLGARIIVYSLDSYLYATYHLGNLLGLSWIWSYKIFWFGMFLLLSVGSSFYLGRQFNFDIKYAALSSLIHSTNTYILMVVGGGQMGVALAYAIAPMVYGLFHKLFSKGTILSYELILFASFALAILMTFDIRIFYIISFAIFFTFLHSVVNDLRNNQIRKRWRRNIIVIGVPFIIALFLNAYWLVPNILHPTNPLESLGKAYTSTESLKFFSFATLSNTLTILHPNWPENIFGKVSFQSALFLTIPVIAFLGLLFRTNKNNAVAVIAILGLVGVFLSKGANDPFSELYVFLFEKLPGFQMFRDSTKWYLLVIISYSILIPISILLLSDFLSKKKKILIYVPILIFIVLWTLLIKEAISWSLRGTFSEKSVPVEYIEFKNLIANDKGYYRTLWVPRQQRYAYSDYAHPSMEAGPLFNATSPAEIVVHLKDSGSEQLLRELSIKYVIIPSDPLSEIFLEDRKYSHKERLNTESLLDSVAYLKKVQQGKLTIYRTQDYNDMFSSDNTGIVYKKTSPVSYTLTTDFLNPQVVVFSQRYDPGWVASSNGIKLKVLPTRNGLISFEVPSGFRNVLIEFAEQRNYNVGWIISLIALLCAVLYPVFRKLWELKK